MRFFFINLPENTMPRVHLFTRAWQVSIPVLLLVTISVLILPATLLAVQAHTQLSVSFQSAQAANKACVTCHAQEDTDLRKSVHWTWQRKGMINGQVGLLDKQHSLARFGLVAAANPEPCLACHLSIMPKMPGESIDMQGVVNCLVCHDTTGRYRADMPPEELLTVVQQAGRPAPRNCRVCHDRDCGLSPDGTGPDSTADIHIRQLGFTCQQCHSGLGGHALVRSMVSPGGDGNRSGCMACHNTRPHDQEQLNRHGRFVACQSCHIPAVATGQPVVLNWNWLSASTAQPVCRTDGSPVIRHGFSAGKHIKPTYFWDDGSRRVYTRGTRIQGQEMILDQPGARSPASTIMPFRTIFATQFKDRKYHYLLSPTLDRATPPFWPTDGLHQAIARGMTKLRLPFSGAREPVVTLQFRPLNHGVVRARDSLGCMDCHGTRSGFTWQQLGYRDDPWQNREQRSPAMRATPPTLGLPPVEESVLPTPSGQ